MSVLIKRIDSASGGGSSKGYPPGNINIIKKAGLNTKVYLRWSDPDNIVVGNQTLSTWSSTILVRKEGSAPNSLTDGTVVITNTTKNKYKDTDLVDSGLTNGKIYYYRFFTMNTDKVYNTDSSMIYTIKISQLDSILKNNTWEAINIASESGIVPSTWKVGDEIDLTLSGAFNETVTLQIWDFKHFDKSDGSGKAGICFGMKHLMKDDQQMNRTATSAGGWNDTYMRNTIMQNILKSMPSNLQNAIKEVNTYANPGSDSTLSSSVGKLCKDKVFLPGATEVYDTWPDQNRTESGQKKFPIFTDNNSRIKKLSNGSERLYSWWTRSPVYDTTRVFCSVGIDSTFYNSTAYDYCGVCFCFNV